jgi:plastocyanin
MMAGRSAIVFAIEWRSLVPPIVFGFFFILYLALFSAPVFGATITGRVVGTDGKGIAQAVVFVQALPAGTPLPGPSQPAVMDQIHKTFIPAVLPITVGSTVHFPNHDQIHHHVYSFSRTKSFELPLYKGEEAPPILFDKAGVVKIGCNIHDWMAAVILVVPTPFYAVTNEAGEFTLSGLPAGTYPLVCWHELSQTKVDETLQPIQVEKDTTEATFSLSLAPARVRLPTQGVRGSR